MSGDHVLDRQTLEFNQTTHDAHLLKKQMTTRAAPRVSRDSLIPAMFLGGIGALRHGFRFALGAIPVI